MKTGDKITPVTSTEQKIILVGLKVLLENPNEKAFHPLIYSLSEKIKRGKLNIIVNKKENKNWESII